MRFPMAEFDFDKALVGVLSDTENGDYNTDEFPENPENISDIHTKGDSLSGVSDEGLFNSSSVTETSDVSKSVDEFDFDEALVGVLSDTENGVDITDIFPESTDMDTANKSLSDVSDAEESDATDNELTVFTPVGSENENDSDATETDISSDESDDELDDEADDESDKSPCVYCGESFKTTDMVNFDTDEPLYCSFECQEFEAQSKLRESEERLVEERLVQEQKTDSERRQWRRRVSPKRKTESDYEPRKRVKCNPEGYNCPLDCGRSFKMKKNIYSHLMGPSGHNGVASYLDETMFKQKGWIPEDYEHYPFKCNVPGCGFEKGEKRQLRTHYEKKHGHIDATVLREKLPLRGELRLEGNQLVCIDNNNGFAVYY